MTLFATTTRRATASVVTGMTLAGAAAAFAAPAQAASVETWDTLAKCESNNTWDINTGNGFYGGLQFHPVTWTALGGTQYAPMAHQATKAEQIAIAEKVLDVQGWGAWPACNNKLNLAAVDAANTQAATPVVRQSTEDASAQQWAAQQAEAEQRAAERAAEQRAAQQAAAAAKVSQSELDAAEEANEENAAELDAAADTVFVKPGDSLWKIAKENNVAGGWTALYEANQDIIEDASMIYVGQELVLPAA